MTNSIVKIVCSSGEPLDTTTEGLEQLDRMGYRTYKDKKLDMRIIGDMKIQGIIMDDISLLINRSETSIRIIAHTHGKRTEDKRENRYYFLYNVNDINISVNLLDILKDFIYKAYEESKKHNFNIIKNNKESISIFENLDKIVSSSLPSIDIDKDLYDVIFTYFNKGQPQFEISSVDKAIKFFISLDSKIGDKIGNKIENKNIYYILYVPKRSNVAKNANAINVYINQDRHIVNIEPIKEFNVHLQNYKRNKIETTVKNKIRDVQNEIEPGIINAREIWKSKRKDLEQGIRKSLAENLYKTVCNFVDDIESEIKLLSSESKVQLRDPKARLQISNVYIEADRRFIYVVLTLLALSVGFVSGLYVESHKIDIPYVHNVVQTPDSTPVPTQSPEKTVVQTQTPNSTMVPTQSPENTVVQTPTPTPKPTSGNKNDTKK